MECPKEADDPNKSVGHKRPGSEQEFIGQSEERHWMWQEPEVWVPSGSSKCAHESVSSEFPQYHRVPKPHYNFSNRAAMLFSHSHLSPWGPHLERWAGTLREERQNEVLYPSYISIYTNHWQDDKTHEATSLELYMGKRGLSMHPDNSYKAGIKGHWLTSLYSTMASCYSLPSTLSPLLCHVPLYLYLSLLLSFTNSLCREISIKMQQFSDSGQSLSPTRRLS